jgi:asparagine synthase (glutamine-hydrolysing)
MAGVPHAVHGDWRCWLFGEPQPGLELAEHRIAEVGANPADVDPAGANPAGANLAGALARALAARGETAVALLSGPFAAVVHDGARQCCWVVRDQLGAQPLVYARVADGALFAEHECDLLDVLPRTPPPDRLAFVGWIENGMPPAHRTLFEGIERVPPGGRLALAEHVAVERWWEPRYAGVQRGSPDEVGGRLREAAFAAIARTATGARRPAVKLSGGLDSASVAAGLAAGGFASRGALALGGAFAANPEADERELIEATARHTGLALELIAHDPTRSMLAPALAHIDRWRLPPGTPNLFVWQPLLARARALGVDVLLDGEGGDELFGFAPYLIADKLGRGRLAGAWSLSARIPGIGTHPDRRVRVRVLRHYGVRPLVPAAVGRRRARANAMAAPNGLIAPADRASLAELREDDERQRREGPVWWRMQTHTLIDMREQLDMGAHFRREAADAGIAIRHPLLHDLRAIETALCIPPELQFDAVRDRPLLRDALRGLIPEEVRTRHDKSHFTELVLAGLHAEEAALIEPLRRGDAPLRAYVSAPALERRLAVAPADRPLLSAGPLWRLAIANLWLLALAGELH